MDSMPPKVQILCLRVAAFVHPDGITFLYFHRKQKMAQQVDFIVVGGGLAGTCLSLQLWQRGKTVALFDQPERNRASAIAAGLFNPITNKVMNKTWRADELFVALEKFFGSVQQQIGVRFFFPTPLYRPFISVEEQNSWMAKSATPGFERYIKEIFLSNRFGLQVHDDFGGILLNHCGYVDVSTLLRAVRTLLAEKGCYFSEAFDLNKMNAHEASYGTLRAGSIIFCEGTANQHNPFFSWLPIHSLKGETLDIQMDTRLDAIYNRGVYVVPGSARQFKVGATYEHNGKPGVSPEGRLELLTKLNTLLKVPYEITNQNWGFRPTIIDRKPVLGAHPDYPRLLIFNGLGTKGVSLAPHFSGMLADCLIGRGQIERDVNISRFYTLYSKF